MARKIDKRKIVFILSAVLIIVVISLKVVNADSGWDSSYSGSSDSSYYGGTSYSDGYYGDSNSSSSNAGGDFITTIFYSLFKIIIQNPVIGLSICIILGIVLVLFTIKVLFSKKNHKAITNNHDAGLTDEEIKKIDNELNSELLKEITFTLYKKIETAKTKQNIKIIKEILKEDLYLEQEKNIKTLKENKQKIVATNIKLENFKVLSIEKQNENKNILIYLHVSQYDYVLDKNKTVIRGTDEAEYQIEYKLIIEKNSANQFKIKKKECIGKWIKN